MCHSPPGYCSRSIGEEILSLAPEVTEQVVVQWEENVLIATIFKLAFFLDGKL